MKLGRYLFLLTCISVVVTACGLLQAPAEPSAPIEAIPLELATSTAAPVPTNTSEPAPTGVLEPAVTETVAPAAADTAVPPTATVASVETATVEVLESGGLRIYTISQADSQVRFELDEDLRGQRTTVVGVTNQVAGQIAADLNDLSTAQVGVIRINARALATDNSFRNRTINNDILQTGAYEFITFVPAAVTGLPASARLGEEVTFTVAGDLTIRNITQPVTFQVTVAAVSEAQLVGVASAVITRADYDLRIPQVPSVANVEEEVELYITFVANAS